MQNKFIITCYLYPFNFNFIYFCVSDLKRYYLSSCAISILKLNV